VTRYEYDDAGNLLVMADPSGRFVEYAYDPLHRRVKTLYPPAAPGQPRPVMATAYDALGRRVAETNEAGVVTALGYDALGRLTTVTNALGLPEQSGVAYTYDEAGNLTTEHRPDNRNTRFEFDGLGRRTRRLLPVNIPTLSESFSYDAAGNRLR
jgi:YD repeat-containing protein